MPGSERDRGRELSIRRFMDQDNGFNDVAEAQCNTDLKGYTFSEPLLLTVIRKFKYHSVYVTVPAST